MQDTEEHWSLGGMLKRNGKGGKGVTQGLLSPDRGYVGHCIRPLVTQARVKGEGGQGPCIRSGSSLPHFLPLPTFLHHSSATAAGTANRTPYKSREI